MSIFFKGGVPSPFDRNLGIKYGAKALYFMLEVFEKSFINGKIEVIDDESSVVIGIRKKQLTTSSIKSLEKETDFE